MRNQKINDVIEKVQRTTGKLYLSHFSEEFIAIFIFFFRNFHILKVTKLTVMNLKLVKQFEKVTNLEGCQKHCFDR